MESEDEVWKPYPEFGWVQGSNLGKIRTVDRYVTYKDGKKRFVKGHALPQYRDNRGYLSVKFSVNGKTVNLSSHRVIASCFSPNPLCLPEVNHMDCDPSNNHFDNLEWCTHEYNMAYKEEYGVSAKESVPKSPIYAINLKTSEKLWFESQHEAGRSLGVDQRNINNVIKGKLRQAKGFWFIEDTGDDFKIDNHKLREIKTRMRFMGGIYAINVKTMEVYYFESQSEAGRELRVNQGHVNNVIAGKRNQTGGFWFTRADDSAVANTCERFGKEVAEQVTKLMEVQNND